MADEIRCFNQDGMSAFSEWLREGAAGPVPPDLLRDDSFSSRLCGTELPVERPFPDRYELGCHLVQLLDSLPAQDISYNAGLWTWLAAKYFGQLSPIGADGTRTLRKEYVYVLSDQRIYYRHLVRTPWFLVSKHGEACRFLLVSTLNDPAPLSRQSYLLDQLAARRFVITSPTLVAAARRLYTDPRTGLPRRGAGAKGQGSPRRLALIANQLSLTYDISDMPVENFMRLLPSEFRWLDLR